MYKKIEEQDVLIIGGGIIGTVIAYQLSRYNLKITILEKNAFFADETTRVNSGIIHSGFDAKPGTYKAKLNVSGNKLWSETIFKYLKFPHKQVNSLVLAFNGEEMKHVQMLYERGLRNNVPKQFMKILNYNQVLSYQKYINPEVVGALLSTSSWIIDSVKASLAFIGAAKNNGTNIKRNAKVSKIEQKDNGFLITINNKEKLFTKNIINAAGHYADQISNITGFYDFKQKTRRGEYRILSKTESHKVQSICFLMPTIYGKGVLVAPMTDGRILVGPTAEDNVPKEDTGLVTQKMFVNIGNIGKKIIPSLKIERTEITNAGSRPIDIETDDFVISYAKNSKHFIQAGGMQSPAISAAPAIALEVEKLLKSNGTRLLLKDNFDPYFEVMW